jgi:hypothetical protein
VLGDSGTLVLRKRKASTSKPNHHIMLLVFLLKRVDQIQVCFKLGGGGGEKRTLDMKTFPD